MATKETTQAVVKDIKALKVEKSNLVLKKENINSETPLTLDSIQRTRSRIVQSPDRIRRNISTMTTTAIEDQKSFAMHEAKARDLQAKIAVLTNIEKVRSFFLPPSLTSIHPKGRTRLHRTIADHRERNTAPRELTKGTRRRQRQPRIQKDRTHGTPNEKGGMSSPSSSPLVPFPHPLRLSECTGSLQMPKKSSIVHRGMQKTSVSQASIQSNDFNVNTSKWTLNDATTTN